MKLRQIASNIIGAIEFVSSMLYIFEKFGFSIVLTPILPSSATLLDVLLVLSIVGAVAFPVWVGYQVAIWHQKSKLSDISSIEKQRRPKLDPLLSHIQARLFYRWYHRYITFWPKWGIPARRALLDWTNGVPNKAWPFDDWNLDLLRENKIKANSDTARLKFSVRAWCEAQGFKWTDKLPSLRDLYHSADLDRLRELERGLTALIFEAPSMQSGDTYVGQDEFFRDRIRFRDRVVRYDRFEADAEALLGVDREEFYLNPDILEASKQNVGYVTQKATDLMRIASKYTRAIGETL